MGSLTHFIEVIGSNTHWGDSFLCTTYLDQKSEGKRENGMFQPTWHSCICCNPANGRVDFENSWLIKIQLHNLKWTLSLWKPKKNDFIASPKFKKKIIKLTHLTNVRTAFANFDETLSCGLREKIQSSFAKSLQRELKVYVLKQRSSNGVLFKKVR